jgi:hypothetical protein
MNFNPFTIVVIMGAIVVSCNDATKKPAAENKIQTINTLTGHAYFFAPSLDSSNCKIIAECDCCADDFLFINDTQFVRIAYCMTAKTVTTGTYSFNGENVILVYDTLALNTEADDNNELKTTAVNSKEYLITETGIEKLTDTLQPYKCSTVSVYQSKIGREHV